MLTKYIHLFLVILIKCIHLFLVMLHKCIWGFFLSILIKCIHLFLVMLHNCISGFFSGHTYEVYSPFSGHAYPKERQWLVLTEYKDNISRSLGEQAGTETVENDGETKSRSA